MSAVAIPVALAVGVVLGLLGGGGSILMVPALVYVLGMDAGPAIATSLVVVGATSAIAVMSHHRGGHVRWRTGLLFGTGGMVGAYVGGRVAGYLPPAALLVGFAAIMLATALAMLARRRGANAVRRVSGRGGVASILLDGLIVGMITGLVGAGGGFLVVPALVLLGGLSMRDAVGTSLLVIALKSGSGVLGHLAHVSLDWGLVAAVTALAILGSMAGERVGRRTAPDRLQRAFGWFVLVAAGAMLARELPQVLG